MITSETSPREPYHQSLSLGPLQRRFLPVCGRPRELLRCATCHDTFSFRSPASSPSYSLCPLPFFTPRPILCHSRLPLPVAPQSLLPKSRCFPILHRPMSQNPRMHCFDPRNLSFHVHHTMRTAPPKSGPCSEHCFCRIPVFLYMSSSFVRSFYFCVLDSLLPLPPFPLLPPSVTAPLRFCARRHSLCYNSLNLPTIRTPISTANVAGKTTYTHSFHLIFTSLSTHFARSVLVHSALIFV